MTIAAPQRRALPRRRMTARPTTVVVTGAAGWLGQNLVRALAPIVAACGASSHATTTRRSSQVVGAVDRGRRRRRARSGGARRLFDGVGADATVFHAAAVIHPARQRPRALRRERRRHAAVLDRAATQPASPGSCTCRRTRRSAPTPTPDDRFDRGRRRTTRTWATGARSRRPRSSCARAHERGDVPTVIVRPPWFYGPYQPAAAVAVVRGGPHGPVPARRRRHAAALDGATPGTSCTACCCAEARRRRAGPGVLDRRRRALRAARDPRDGPRRPRRPRGCRCRAPLRRSRALAGVGGRDASTASCRSAGATCRRCTCSAS